MKSIIFHIPFKPNSSVPSGTNIRPLRMLEGFKDLNFDVDVVMGSASERKGQIKKIKALIKSGKSYEFMYSESGTLPNLLTETHHMPTHPFLDFSFFKFCQESKIPIGLFYRDVYWNFDDYKLSGIKAKLTRSMYHLDLRNYEKYLHTLFLPSLAMERFIPLNKKMNCQALPSGLQLKKIDSKSSSKLTFFYVGGISAMYTMHELFKAFNKCPEVQLIFCTRKKEWQEQKASYEKYLGPNISIHHVSGQALDNLMKEADIGLLYFKPNTYRSFAMPVKLFEYLSYDLPIISSTETATGEYIKNNKLGWLIPYDHYELINLINLIKNDKELLLKRKEYIKTIKEKHTWQHRAKEVAEALAPKTSIS